MNQATGEIAKLKNELMDFIELKIKEDVSEALIKTRINYKAQQIANIVFENIKYQSFGTIENMLTPRLKLLELELGRLEQKLDKIAQNQDCLFRITQDLQQQYKLFTVARNADGAPGRPTD